MKNYTKAMVAVSAAAVLTLSACGRGGDAGTDGGGGGGGEELDIALVSKGFQHQFWQAVKSGAEEKAEELGVTMTFDGPASETEVDAQLQMLQAAIERQPDAIGYATLDPEACVPLLEQADSAGIPIVEFDAGCNTDVPVTICQTDSMAAGALAAEHMAELIGGKGKVLVVNVKPGISTTDQRGQGFEEEVKGKPGVEYLGQEYSQDDPAIAAQIVTSTLSKHPDLKGIFATNLFTAEGAASGLRQAGKLGDVKIVGFDGGPKQVKDLEDGLVQALIAQKPADIGRQGVEQAVKALKGEETTPEIGTDFEVITKENLSEMQDVLYKPSC